MLTPSPSNTLGPLLLSISNLSTLLYSLREVAWIYKNALVDRNKKVLDKQEVAELAVTSINIERDILNTLSAIRAYSSTAFTGQVPTAQHLSSTSVLSQSWTLLDEIFRSITSDLIFSLSFSSYFDGDDDNQSSNLFF
jgi:hypothetical protein